MARPSILTIGLQTGDRTRRRLDLIESDFFSGGRRMAKAGRKTQEMKHIGFRMPLDVHRDYVTVAESRGVDLSAILNWVLNEFRPALLLKHAQHQAAMLRASIVDPQKGGAENDDKEEAITSLNGLIRQMQELTILLQKRPPSDGGQRAA
jgi:hypothetical protein